MQLVDEQDDFAFRFLYFLQDGLEPLLEFSPEFGPGHQRAQVQRHQTLIFESFRHIFFDDPTRQPFDDGRLPDTWLSDEHRIIFGSAREDLNHPPDFLIPPDHRIELAPPGHLGEIAPVFFQRLILSFRILVGYPLTSPNAGQHLVNSIPGHAVIFEYLSSDSLAPFLSDRDEQMLGADVVILHVLGFFFGIIENLPQPR